MKLLIFYWIGDLIERNCSIDQRILFTAIILAIFIIVLFSFLSFESRWMRMPWLSLSILLLITCLGIWGNKISSNIKKEVLLTCKSCFLRITEVNKPLGSRNSYTAEVIEYNNNKSETRGKCRLYASNMLASFSEGDVVFYAKDIFPINDLHNPGEFDFKKYNTEKGIYYSVTVNKETEFLRIGNYLSGFQRMLLFLRNYTVGKLRKFINKKDVLGIAEAMLIGYKNDLSYDLNKVYSNAGISHVIAISGMHLGLMYWLIHCILGIVFKKRKLLYASIFLTLPLLWIFAFATGGSASVIRSVIMYSFIIIGNALRRQHVAMNALLGAAFLMMLHQPDIIFDIGFQLSFSAVFSILAFYRNIRNLLYLKNKLLIWTWEAISLSLSALIITTPLIILHFQQVASFSLLNNLLIVPLSSIALFFEILLCISPFEILSRRCIAPIIEISIQWMNNYAAAMNKVHFSVFETPFLKWYELLLYSLAAYFLLYALVKKKSYFLYFLIIACFIRCSLNAIQLNGNLHERIILLNIRSAGCLVHQHRNRAMIFVYGDWKSKERSITSTIKSCIKYLGIKNYTVQDLGQTPMVLKNQPFTHQLLLNGSEIAPNDWEKLFQKNNPVVVDGSTKLWKIKQWEKGPQHLLLSFLITAEMGPIFIDCRNFHQASVKNQLHAKKNSRSADFGLLQRWFRTIGPFIAPAGNCDLLYRWNTGLH